MATEAVESLSEFEQLTQQVCATVPSCQGSRVYIESESTASGLCSFSKLLPRPLAGVATSPPRMRWRL